MYAFQSGRRSSVLNLASLGNVGGVFGADCLLL